MAQYFKTHMHMHTSFEQFASMRSHCVQAKKLGIDGMFITDHDVRMNRFKDGIEHFYLKRSGDAVLDNGTGWHNVDGSPASAAEDGQGYALLLLPNTPVTFSSVGKRHQSSLLSDFCLDMDFVLPKNTALRIDITLSLNEKLNMQHMFYDFGCCPKASQDDWVIPHASASGALHVHMPLSEDVLRFHKFGLDNCFSAITLCVYGGENALCRGFDTCRRWVAEDVRVRQQALADEIGAEYGIKLYIADEISLGQNGVEGHFNSFSDYVPLINYEEVNYSYDFDAAMAHLRRFGGTGALNHPLSRYKRGAEKDTREKRRKLIEDCVNALDEKHCWNLQAIEVGFPEGRYGFDCEEQLEVWDELTLRGYKLTGYGDSDNHDSRNNWFSGNNFATWIYAETNERRDIENGLRSGRVYTADPARWNGYIRFSANGTEMGEVCRAENGKAVHAEIDIVGMEEPFTLRLMYCGSEVGRFELQEADAHISADVVKERSGFNALRFEMIAKKDGRYILLSNPVFLWDGSKRK